MKKWSGFERGMGIGGWLTNYKRFNVLPDEWRMVITEGDMEHFETYITDRDADRIRGMGFDHVRIGFDQIVLEESPYVYRRRTMELLKNFVLRCRAVGLNVVLNLHKSIGNYCDIAEEVTLFDSAELQSRFIALWVELERNFSDVPEVAFELLNEVRDVDPEAWNGLASRALAAIRERNPARTVVVGTTKWNHCAKLRDLRLYDDENVVYTFHNYEPFAFTHQRGVLQRAPLFYNRALKYPSDDAERYHGYYRLLGKRNPYAGVTRIDRAVLETILAPAVEFTEAHPDKILWCGEFGTIRHADPDSRENWMRDMVSILKEHGIPYCVWNYLSTPNDGNRFSLVDDDTREILSPSLLRALLGED